MCQVTTKLRSIFGGGVCNFRLHFLSHFFFNFENLSAHLVANILNFPKHPKLLHLCQCHPVLLCIHIYFYLWIPYYLPSLQALYFFSPE